MLLWTYMCKYLFKPRLSILLGTDPEGESMVMLFNFLRNPCTVFHSDCTISRSHSDAQGLLHPRPHPNLGFWQPSWRVWGGTQLWVWSAPLWQLVVSRHWWAFGQSFIFLRETSTQVFCPFFKWVVFLFLNCSSLHILKTRSLSDVQCTNIFSPYY